MQGKLKAREKELAALRTAGEKTAARLAELRGSATYRIGRELKGAATSPRAALRLPTSLGRLFAGQLAEAPTARPPRDRIGRSVRDQAQRR